jgi:hypothetical protein
MPLSNALVAVAKKPNAQSPDNGSLRADRRPRADFIAHLIATSAQAPQTCQRRRAAPEEVTAAYDARGQSSAAPGGALSRSL